MIALAIYAFQQRIAAQKELPSKLRSNETAPNNKQPVSPPRVRWPRKPSAAMSGSISGLLLSLEANRLANTVEGRGSLLEGLQRSLHLTTFLTGHTNAVLSVAFSPDGKTLASGSVDKTIKLWDVATAGPGPTPDGAHGRLCVAFSPDGKTLASGSGDKTIKLWDVASREPLGQPLAGHTKSVSERGL